MKQKEFGVMERELKFLADSMLGNLAKWLRVLGYDTHYQSNYSSDAIDRLVRDGRRLLTRHMERAGQYDNAVLLKGNHVGEQLTELRKSVHLATDRTRWFARCLICNTPLETAREDAARSNVPEYVFYRYIKEIKFCPFCDRYFWPGTHRKRMSRQLEAWGFWP
jgi:uncharacterized protein with PIN domain